MAVLQAAWKTLSLPEAGTWLEAWKTLSLPEMGKGLEAWKILFLRETAAADHLSSEEVWKMLSRRIAVVLPWGAWRTHLCRGAELQIVHLVATSTMLFPPGSHLVADGLQVQRQNQQSALPGPAHPRQAPADRGQLRVNARYGMTSNEFHSWPVSQLVYRCVQFLASFGC